MSGQANAAAVSVVVLNWNGKADTLDCLQSLRAVDYPNFTVHVVDNASSDDSVPTIRAAFPEVELICSSRNLGYAGGNNLGIRRALEIGAQYILLLNNDTVVDPGLLSALVKTARRYPHAAAFGAKILLYGDRSRVWYAGARWDEPRSCFVQIGEGLPDDDASLNEPQETAYACGCAFFMSAKRAREIGFLDENFFLYFEESDWCYRARRRGYPSIFVPDARLWHKVSVSFGGERSPLALYFLTRNRLLWAKRHAGLGRRVKVYAATAAGLAQRLLGTVNAGTSMKQKWWALRAAFRDPRNRAYFLGARDYVLARFGDCPDEVRAMSKQWSARQASSPAPSALPRESSADA